MRTLKKAMLIALAALCLNLSASAQAISLRMSNTTVKEAMDALKKTSGYVFVFSSVDVDTGKRISINANNADMSVTWAEPGASAGEDFRAHTTNRFSAEV